MQEVIKTTGHAIEGVQKPTALKPHIAEQWEINTIGNFLLELLNTGMLTAQKNWEVEKFGLRREYDRHVSKSPLAVVLQAKLKEVNGTADIGTLLYRTNFLLNTPRGSSIYRIKDASLLKFRHETLALLDEKQKGGITAAGTENGADGSNDEATIDLELAIKEHNVDENSAHFPLKYQGTETQKRLLDFGLNSFGCFICQKNFETIDDYEDHLEYHGDESDFKSLEMLSELSSPMLKLYYQLCIKSHYFCFTIETTHDNIIIDKIIIVQSRSFYYVNNGQMPYKMPTAGKYQFFVDSHLFTIYQEQPIVFVFRQANGNEEERYVEQHHFKRTEPFPLVNFAINPYRLSHAMTFKPKYKLENYLPNKTLLKTFENIPSNDALFEMSADFKDYYKQKKCFTLQNISKAMEIMLRVEDAETMHSYRRLMQTKVSLRQVGKELTLRLNTPKSENVLSPYDDVIMIPEEKQQNIDIMDMITNTVEDMRNRKKKMYLGRVERVNNCRVTFESDMIVPEKATYTVLFRPNRLLIRRQYRALELLKFMGDEVLNRFLFPTIDRTMHALAGMFSLDLNDKSFYENPEQYQAIKEIATSNRLEAPYIIFGPPGTGKTATIVEAIMQLYLQRSNTKILIMAGSNSACDEIALRLLKIITKNVNGETKTLTRIFSQTNDKRIDNIDELLLDYSNMYDAHFYPHVEILHLYRIVVCTLAVAGKLATGKFGKDVDGAPIFTHVFVDEAAASTEAETLMGIVCAMSPRASLILSGDHKQLGPIIQSNRAGDLGLNVSLMERLLQRECYQVDEENGNYNRSIQTRLIRNYRSHAQIVKLYSQLYYDDKLLALSKSDDINFCENWYLLPNRNFPIIFHSEFGTAERGNNSVSLCNNREIDTVLLYVSELMHFGVDGKKVKQSDIGIISPYKNQYMRIQEQLNIRNWHHIECGSVETFQGKEKLIIIVSFVRSFSASLGFLDNPRRLNVTLSRPKSLLILVGNPHTLSMNSDYKFIIDMCKANNTCIGAKIYNDFNANKLPENTQQPKESNKQRKRREWQQRTNKEHKANGTKSAAKNVPKTVENVAVLGQAMKKRVNPVSKQKQRQKVETFKNIIQQDERKTELDELFDGLPSVPTSDETSTNSMKSQTVKEKPIMPKKFAAKPKPTVPQTTNTATSPIVGSTVKTQVFNMKSNVSSVNNVGGGAVPKMTNGTSTGIRPLNVVTPTTSSYNTQYKVTTTPTRFSLSESPMPFAPINAPRSTATTVHTPVRSDQWTGQGLTLNKTPAPRPTATSVPRPTVTSVPRPTVYSVPHSTPTSVPRPTAAFELRSVATSPSSRTPLFASGINSTPRVDTFSTGQASVGYVSSRPSRSPIHSSNFESYPRARSFAPAPPREKKKESNCIIA